MLCTKFRPFSGCITYLGMFSLLLLGVFTAVGQHGFYTYLHLKLVDAVAIDQTWVIRIGNAFSFLVKTSLVAAVGIAFWQSFWHTIRHKELPVKSIDSVFGVLVNPLQFFDRNLLLKTPLLFIMALIAWCLPLTAIFAPGALTVNNQVQVPIVGTLDHDVGLFEVGSADSLLGPTVALQRIALQVLTTSSVIPWSSSCGDNCTYPLIFLGPAFECLPATNLTQVTANPFVQFNATSSDGVGLSPVSLLIAYGPNNTQMNCTLYNSTYKLDVVYFNNLLNIHNVNVTFHNAVPSSAGVAYEQYIGTRNQTIYSTPQWWTFLNQYTLAGAVSGNLVGSLSVTVNRGWIADRTLIGVSTLVNLTQGSSATFPENFEAEVERLMINTTLSLCGFTTQAIFPGAGGATSSPPGNLSSVDATITTFPPRYTYAKAVFWEIYSAGFTLSSLCLLIGYFATFRNGVGGDNSFSQILVTTRNSALDTLCEGSELGGERITSRVKEAQVMLGMVGQEGRHVGFGLKNETDPIPKRMREVMES